MRKKEALEKESFPVLDFLNKVCIFDKTWFNIFTYLGAFLVLLKVLLFYHFIGIASNGFLVVLITLFFIFVLFYIFKIKWIPLSIYTLVTILMFADVSYSSFFNRYLSVNLMGSFEMLGAIGESIKAVLRPGFFLLFVDVIYIGILLYVGNKIKSEVKQNEEI
ncbi:MAG: hypothetical protein WCY49_04445 [Anaerovoracaceae bacterium]